MDVKQELQTIRYHWKYASPIRKLACNEKFCEKLTEWIDTDNDDGCDPVTFVQQILLEIDKDITFERAEARLNFLKEQP